MHLFFLQIQKHNILTTMIEKGKKRKMITINNCGTKNKTNCRLPISYFNKNYCMKFSWNIPVIATIVFCIYACNATTNEAQTTNADETSIGGGQSAVQDNESAKDVVKVAAGSKDHTTLVAAVKQ